MSLLEYFHYFWKYINAPNNYHLEIIKNALTKPYEQMWSKTFYFEAKLFVELLGVMGSPPKFFCGILENV